MRFAILGLGILLVSSSAYAQAPCAAVPTYDPYKPSDLAIMRAYGGAVMSQAPLSTLLKLDPYVPSQAELLRQVGRGIPVWATYAWFPSPPRPAVADCAPAPAPAPDASPAPSVAPLTTLADVLTVLERERVTTRSASPTAVTPATGERVFGVSIAYEGRTWLSAGAAVSLTEAEFVRVGESGGTAVFRRRGSKDDVIFVPTTTGMAAPFRARRTPAR